MDEESPKGDTDTNKLYEILGVKKDATESEMKKAYYRLAKEKHPDKGGSEEDFKELQMAYEILKDPQKRKIYDKYGMEGLKEGGGMPSGINT